MSVGGWNGHTGPKFDGNEREEVLAYVAEMDRRGYTQMEIARAIGSKFPKWDGTPRDVAQSTVSTMLKQIRLSYQERRHVSMDAAREEKRYQYGEIRKKAWEAYEALCIDTISITEESEAKPPQIRESNPFKKVPNPAYPRKKGEPVPKTHEELEMHLRRIIVKSENKRAAGAQFLAIIMRCLDAEREMDGLVAQKITVIPSQPTLDWDALIRRLPTPAQAMTKAIGDLSAAQENNSSVSGTQMDLIHDDIERRISELEAGADKVVSKPHVPPNVNGNGQHLEEQP